MHWNSPDNTLPAMATRVLVETEEGSILFGRRVNSSNPAGWHWIDDQSVPIRSQVVRWTFLVADDETPA